ncbi:uncharacterized protein CXorf38 homolog [Brachyistius frenatus]|uniref:uncharacterized protein CXorf38 homolog n=1 Tax=Brachyistius frenatus TaxID=100188 RepID=UPI0037E71738
MVLEELKARLNNKEYKNWLKAGKCLVVLKKGLHPFTDRHMKAFHGDLLNRHPTLRDVCETSSCSSRGNKLSSSCRVCTEWKKVILNNRRQPDTTVNWDNCVPPLWRTDHWELAKAYMPRGLAKAKAANQCDASALLNLINYCECFQSVDLKPVREVIRYRNELMHSCELRMKDNWMRRYETSLKQLVKQFDHVPEMATAEQQIDEILTADLSIHVSGLDHMDGVESDSFSQWETNADLVTQWEAELLQEMLQEFLHVADDDDDDDAKTQHTEQLRSLGGFLQANNDLSERFATELQAINSLQARD